MCKICQHHCPVSHVAEELPELREISEQQASGRGAGTVQRLATIVNGDCARTTTYPRRRPQPAPNLATSTEGSVPMTLTPEASKSVAQPPTQAPLTQEEKTEAVKPAWHAGGFRRRGCQRAQRGAFRGGGPIPAKKNEP